jgi:lysozyme family protein
MVDRFNVCLPFTLAQECPFPQDWSNRHNFSNDAHDPGGKTMCGIIQREYDHWRKAHDLPVRDVRELTREEGEQIYRANYWLPHCLDLPPGLDLQLFDESVNTGTFEGIKVLQAALGVLNDGIWGAGTAAAVKSIPNVRAAIAAFTVRRKYVYRQMRGFRYFGEDWLRRSDQIGSTALKMAANAAAVS